MNTAFSRMNPRDLFDRVVAGLQDEHDIQMLCNLMLTKLAVMDPEETVRRLDSIAERFQAILSTKLKENAVKQEVEKAQEARTDVLRATVRLQAALQSASSSVGQSPTPVWRSYWEFVGKEFKMQLHAAESVVRHQR
jgi:cullin-associated NEDD8-dissociated protein 1